MAHSFAITLLRQRIAPVIERLARRPGHTRIDHVSEQRQTTRIFGRVGRELEDQVDARHHLQVRILLRRTIARSVDDDLVVTTL